MKGQKRLGIKGDWVRIHSVVLKPEERAGHLPEDTKGVPLEMWDKGWLTDFVSGDGAAVGEEVEIETVTGRRARGTLVEVYPAYRHSFGNYIPEIHEIDRTLTSVMKEVRDAEQE